MVVANHYLKSLDSLYYKTENPETSFFYSQSIQSSLDKALTTVYLLETMA